MTPPLPASRGALRDALGLAVALAVCQGAGVLGSLLTVPSLAPWYEALRKPAWNPPDWVFAPVWTTLFLLMGLAAWRVWRKAGWSGGRAALGLFALQLALNVTWSALFFGLRSPGAALLEIVALWAAIAATLAAFARHSRGAAALLAPYLAWVTFAAALNAAIWWLNG